MTEEKLNGLSKVKSIIAISSCKGGVGKSTVAAHLAMDIVSRGFKVGLVDTDIHGPSIPSLFNLNSVELRTNDQNFIFPVEKNGLKIMSFGFLLGDGPAVMRGPMTSRYVQQILFQTAWGDLDYLFIDMPPGTGDIQLTITQSVQLNGAVIITTPQTLSLLDVSRGILMFEKVNVPVLGLIENMSFFTCDDCQKKHYIFGRNGHQSLHERFGIDLLGELPILPQMTHKIDKPEVNEYVRQAADNTVRALGKSRIHQHQTPDIHFDAKEIQLKWTDGTTMTHLNADLRLRCRCALCIDEVSGEQIFKKDKLKSNIAAKSVTPLGNYAINVVWNDGHSSSIYPYKMLQTS